jgi:hypothetical protein
MPKLCPSAQPGMDRCRVLGVVQRDGPVPILEYLEQPLSATPDVLALAAPLKPTEIFRLAATCAEHKCPHFDGADCRLASRIVRMLPPAVDTLPPCNYSQRVPLVLARGCSRMQALSRGHHRDLRFICADTGSIGPAGRARGVRGWQE